MAVAGDAWADRAGGTSGALWGLLLRSWSAELSDNGNIDDGAVVRGGRRALDAVTTLGRAKPGDKTLVDAFVPFMETLENAFASGKPLADAWKQAAEVAKVAAEATAPLTRNSVGQDRWQKRALAIPTQAPFHWLWSQKSSARN